MSTTSIDSARVYHDTISQRARELWRERGRPPGKDVEIWLDAERDLVARGLIPPTPSARPIRRGRAASDEIDENALSDQLSRFGDRGARSATSLDPTEL